MVAVPQNALRSAYNSFSRANQGRPAPLPQRLAGSSRMQASETGPIVGPSFNHTDDVASGRGRCCHSAESQPVSLGSVMHGMAADGRARNRSRAGLAVVTRFSSAGAH